MFQPTSWRSGWEGGENLNCHEMYSKSVPTWEYRDHFLSKFSLLDWPKFPMDLITQSQHFFIAPKQQALCDPRWLWHHWCNIRTVEPLAVCTYICNKHFRRPVFAGISCWTAISPLLFWFLFIPWSRHTFAVSICSVTQSCCDGKEDLSKVKM